MCTRRIFGGGASGDRRVRFKVASRSMAVAAGRGTLELVLHNLFDEVTQASADAHG